MYGCVRLVDQYKLNELRMSKIVIEYFYVGKFNTPELKYSVSIKNKPNY